MYVSIFLALAADVILYVIVLSLSGKTYNQIEDKTALFVSLLCNHAKGSSDIVTVMDQTAKSLNEPMHSLVKQFVSDAEKTGNVDVAFDLFKRYVLLGATEQSKRISLDIVEGSCPNPAAMSLNELPCMSSCSI